MAQEHEREGGCNDDLFRCMFDMHSSVMLLIDPEDGRVVDANLAAEQFYGWSRAELTGMSIQAINQLDATDIAARCRDAAARNCNRFTFPHKLRSGEVRTVEVYSTPIDVKGKATLFSIIHDVTERQRAEDALQASEAQLRAIYQNAPLLILLIDREQRLVRLNAPAERMAGRSVAKVAGLRAGEALRCVRRADDPRGCGFGPNCHTCGVRNAVLQTIETGQSFYRTEATFAHDPPDGPVDMHFLVSTTPLAVLGEELVLVCIEDDTAHKHAQQEQLHLERQLQQAQKLESLGLLAGGIAHDFNNILGSVLGNLSVALRELPADSPLRPLLQDSRLAARRAADLSGQMLAYSGKGAFAVADVDVNALIRGMAGLINSATSKKAALSFELADALPAIKGNATQLRQVLLNLVSNAAEAVGKAAGLIRIVTRLTDCNGPSLDEVALCGELPKGPYLTIEVTDNGGGIDEPIRAKIFDPFFSTKFAGRGLGLAVVQGIVRGHNGAIRVHSEVGKGTTVCVMLPALARPATATSSSPPEATAWSTDATIMLVDDDEMLRRVVQRMLVRCGLKVLLASDGVEAVEVFREHHGAVDCVLLDLVMPGMNGVEVLAELRRINDTVPVLLTSGYSERVCADLLGGDSVAGFIQKPYELGTLQSVLLSVLDASRAATQREPEK